MSQSRLINPKAFVVSVSPDTTEQISTDKLWVSASIVNYTEEIITVRLNEDDEAVFSIASESSHQFHKDDLHITSIEFINAGSGGSWDIEVIVGEVG